MITAVQLTSPLRKAVPEDAARLAELVNYAGEGLPLYLWSQLADPGTTAWEVGRQRAMREAGSFSYRNAIVVDDGTGAAAGCLIGYEIPDTVEPVPETMPAMFRPLQELENLAPGTWYVNVLAAVPDERCKGHGTRLLAVAEDVGRAAGKRGMSVIVSDGNPGARRLYERTGYAEIASRPMHKERWESSGRNWVLLTKAL